MKTLDIQAKEWFDKVNGNSYFSARVTVDFSLPTEQVINVPFQYGYGDTYEYESLRQLQTAGVLKDSDAIYSPSRYCRERDIVLRSSIQRKCLKAQVKAWANA